MNSASVCLQSDKKTKQNKPKNKNKNKNKNKKQKQKTKQNKTNKKKNACDRVWIQLNEATELLSSAISSR